jgi:FkbM family methyltransferase
MLKIEARPPVYFRLVQHRIAANQRGGYLLWRVLSALHDKFGLLDRCAPFDISERETILVPLYWPLIWRPGRVRQYETYQVNAFSRAVASLGDNVIMIDCGADVGVFSRLVLTRTSNITLLHAFEPNSKSCFVLRKNLQDLGFECHAHEEALSDYEGTASLLQPEYSATDHARYIKRGDGEIKVSTIDSLGLPKGRSIALKIDVEGEELSVLRGACRTLHDAAAFVVQIEANAEVTARIGIDAVEAIKFVRDLRSVSVRVLHDYEGESPISPSLDRPFFAQFPHYKSCDILLTTTS